MRGFKLFVTMMGALGLLAATGAGALAAGEPTDAELLEATPVGVLPVLAPGLSRDAQYRRVAAAIAVAGQQKATGNGAKLVDLSGDDGGFGFAGSATTSDIRILEYAFIAGSLPSASTDPKTREAALKYLESARGALASLSPDVVAQVDAYVAKAKAGTLDAESLSKAMMAAETGIAKGPARGHGYFAAGVWLGLSVLVAALDEPAPDYLVMAEPLAVMLDEDAEFGGADRTLAAELRAVASLLGKPGATMAQLEPHLTNALSLRPDAPAEPAAAE